MSVDFKAKQAEFAAYIRDPEHHPMPSDVNPERIAMYRELFFNNIDSFLASNFPVIRRILDDKQWYELAQDFFARHQCSTPYFVEIPEEFLAYLQNERQNPADWPFLYELAHYEWVEMALSIAQEPSVGVKQKPDDFLMTQISLSPLAWLLAYRYPVHRIAPTYLPTVEPNHPTFLVVYRDNSDDVHFLEITAMTYCLLDRLQQQNSLLTQDCLAQIAQESGLVPTASLISGGLQILEDLFERGVVVLAE